MDARRDVGMRYSRGEGQSRLHSGGFCGEQGVKGMPSLLVNSPNKFLTLDVEEADDHTLSKDVPREPI